MPGTNFSDGAIALGGTVDTYLANPAGHTILARCTVANVPSGVAGYAKGCIIQATDNGAVYSNTGTTSSCTFTLLESAIGGVATALVDSNGLTALDTAATASAVNNLRVTNSATGAVTANAVLLSAVGTDAAISIQISPKGATGKLTLGLATGTGDITLGSSSGAQSVKIGDGAGVSTVNIANNGATGNVVNIATGAFAATITIGNSTGATAVAYLAGSGKHIFTGVINATSPVFVTPVLGVAAATSIATSGLITSSSPSAGIGYATGAGGASTQATSRTTTVVASPNPSMCGTITLFSQAQASDAIVSFTLTNSAIAATDQIIVQHDSVGTKGAYYCTATPAAGSALITVTNVSAGSLTEAIVLRYTIIKGVVA